MRVTSKAKETTRVTNTHTRLFVYGYDNVIDTVHFLQAIGYKADNYYASLSISLH